MGLIALARVYDDAAADHGPRFLVERPWPGGIRRHDNAVALREYLTSRLDEAGVR